MLGDIHRLGENSIVQLELLIVLNFNQHQNWFNFNKLSYNIQDQFLMTLACPNQTLSSVCVMSLSFNF